MAQDDEAVDAGRTLRVTIWQHASSLDPAENREALHRVEDLVGGADLVVLPEAFARDFGEPGSELAAYAESTDGPFLTRLRALVADRPAHVLAGFFEVGPDPGRPFNTLGLVSADGAHFYRKIHLYDSFGHRESDTVSPGPITPLVVDLPVGDASVRLGLMTCYDLRFPELARALAAEGAEVIAMPAAWVAGDRKLDQWRTLLRARAIENVCWVVAAAQPGPRYTGHSMVVDPTGEVAAEAGAGEEVLALTLDLDAVARARRRNPSLANRRM